MTRGCPSKDAHQGVIENQISLKKRMRNILKNSVSNSEHRFLLTSGEGHVKNSVRPANLSKVAAGSRRSQSRPLSLTSQKKTLPPTAPKKREPFVRRYVRVERGQNSCDQSPCGQVITKPTQMSSSYSADHLAATQAHFSFRQAKEDFFQGTQVMQTEENCRGEAFESSINK